MIRIYATNAVLLRVIHRKIFLICLDVNNKLIIHSLAAKICVI